MHFGTSSGTLMCSFPFPLPLFRKRDGIIGSFVSGLAFLMDKIAAIEQIPTAQTGLNSEFLVSST